MRDAVAALIGKYEVERELGRGASATVYLARDPFNDRPVAIKVFQHSGEAGLQALSRKVFLNEAALVGKLVHPHIVGLLDAGLESDYSYVVMEYVPGGTLARYARPDFLLPVESVVEVVFKVSRALEYAQRQGVIHRDIKPANILVTDRFEVKLSDFGAAVLNEFVQTTAESLGSPAYMSPEQLAEQPLNHQTDIYSLGVVLFQLLTGRHPFTGTSHASLVYQIVNHQPPSLRSLRADLPAAFEAIVARAMHKDLRIRYQEWDEFSRDLGNLLLHLGAADEEASATRKFHALKGLPFFARFNEIEIWEILRISEWRRIAKDSVMTREGDHGDALYVLVEGRVTVTRAGQMLAVLGPGDMFGEMLYFVDDTAERSTTIVAQTPLTVIEIKAAALNGASDACQVQFNKACMRLLLERLTAANRLLAGR